MSFPYLGDSALAVALLSLLLIPPGFVVAYALNVAGFRGRSRAERLLWSVSLSYPLSMIVAGCIGPVFGSAAALAVSAAFLLAFVVLVVRRLLGGPIPRLRPWNRDVVIAGLIMAAVALFIALCNVPLILHNSLYEGTSFVDWSVRVPQLAAVARGHGLPVNSLGTVGGVALMHYYYYWFALAGFPAKVVALPARALMVSGCIWSAFVLYSGFLLLLKYLFLPAKGVVGVSVRRLGLWVLAFSFVLGPDCIQAIIWLYRTGYLYSEIEWWRTGYAFSPSFVTCYTFSPHLAPAVATSFIGVLLLVLPVLRPGDAAGAHTARQRLLLGTLAGICFGAILASATFVAVFFAIIWTALFLERSARRDWKTVAAILVGGLTAILCAAPFLYILHAQPSSPSGIPLHFEIRGLAFTRIAFTTVLPRIGMAFTNHHQWLKEIPLYAVLELTEPGIFLLVVLYRFRKDWLGGDRLSPAQALQWTTFTVLFLCAMFLNSSVDRGANDLGLHAALGLRFISVLWAAPLAWAIWKNPARRRWLYTSPIGVLAVSLLALGVLTQLWQLTLHRAYDFILAKGIVNRSDALNPDPVNFATTSMDAFQAAQAIDHSAGARDVILTDPYARIGGRDLYYSNHLLVAGNGLCFAVYGGNAAACALAMPSLLRVYQAVDAQDPRTGAGGHSAAALNAICTQFGARLALATSDDPVWHDHDSWVWQLAPVYGNSTRRVFRCGGNSSLGHVQ